MKESLTALLRYGNAAHHNVVVMCKGQNWVGAPANRLNELVIIDYIKMEVLP